MASALVGRTSNQRLLIHLQCLGLSDDLCHCSRHTFARFVMRKGGLADDYPREQPAAPVDLSASALPVYGQREACLAID